MSQSLQDEHGKNNVCFGCGPENAGGLRLKSFPDGDEVVATWTAQKHHEAFPGVLNGGIIGALLDCHGVWTTVHSLMKQKGLDRAPCVVTADFAVKFKRPTPTSGPIHLRARVVDRPKEDRAVVEGELSAGGEICATMRGLFVSVKPEHPAYHRW